MMNTLIAELKTQLLPQEKSHSAEMGEQIGYEKGAKLVKNHYDQNDGEVVAHFIGRNMIEAILAQPGVVGITILSGVNENGFSKPVLVGVDSKGNYILNITTVGFDGKMTKQKGIVASGVMSPGKGTTPSDCGWYS